MKRIRPLQSFGLFQKIVACVLSATIPLATLPEAALALPHGGVVSKGSATLGYSTGRLLVTQTTTSATFNWGSFNVKSGQSVLYKTPGSSSVSMNYIGGTTPSSINGKVSSNGILYFMNPNGLIFGSGSVVSAAGVLAFGSSTPWGTPTGSVTNAGTLTAATGGTVALVGTAVTNSGTIKAPGGEVLLAAGSTVTPISGSGSSSLSLATTGGGLVDDSGILSAETVNGKAGTILLQSGMQSGTTTLDSTAVLDASAPNGGNGGAITVNGYKVVLGEIAPLNVSAPYGTPGTITIDPTTLDIGTASALETVDGNGTAANQSGYLADTICLTANINLGGSYPWIPLGTSSSAAFTGTFNGNGHMVCGYTITAANNNGTGFIGYLGHGGKVENLGVSGTVNGGSFEYIGGVVGENCGTVETSYNTGSVSGHCFVGGVVGYNAYCTVESSYNTGTVRGTGNFVGGVVGCNYHATVETSYNTGTVSGTGSYVGGVVGENNSSGMVESSYNTGNISGGNYVGGVVGWNCHATVETSYNTGSVSGSTNVGGVVGVKANGTVSDNYFLTSSSTYAIGNCTSSSGSNGTNVALSSFSTTTPTTTFANWSTLFNTWSSGAFQSSATSAPWFEGTVVSGSGTMTAPMLMPDLATATVTENGTSVYSGSTVSPVNTTTYTLGGSAIPSGITVSSPSVGPNAGTYTVTPSVSGTISSAPTTQTSVDSVSAASGTWTITKATLTATANSASMTYGGTVPVLSGTVTGFVNGQTLSGDGGSASWTTTATSTSNIGTYGITGTVSVLVGFPYSGDYTVIQSAGNSTALTITAATSTTGTGSSGSSGTGSSGSSGTGSSGSSTAGGITSTNFTPVLQTVDLSQELPSLPGTSPGPSSPGNFSDSRTPSGNSNTLSSGGETSLTVIQPFGDDTSGSGILSAQELRQ